jgi:C1A family cysteine protease
MKRVYLILIASFFLPVSINAAEEAIDVQVIREAIADQGRAWTAVDYGRTFSLGLIRDKKETLSSQDYFTYSGKTLPSSIDWGPEGLNYVSPVKDQETCGACWAFSAVGALESTIAILENTPGDFYDLSEQILISCCASANGCSGGSTLDAARFLRTDGTYYEDCFPYQSSDIPCDQACSGWRNYSFKIQDYQPIEWTLEALKEAIYLHGPVQSTMDVHEDFYDYSDGVYEYTYGKYLGGHAIVLIGYQDNLTGEYGGGYFICKNSWGTNWGEGGYFNVGYNQVSYDMNFGDYSYIYFFDTMPPLPPTPTNDFNGDGSSDIALFRPGSGLWAVRSISRFYFGSPNDLPIPGDYNGDHTTDIGLFRPAAGLWAIRGITRYYFGARYDIPTPGDYNGDGTCEPGLFRPSSGLWAIKGISRAYFGTGGDKPVARDYTGDGTISLALFRANTGLWAIRFISRFYFGGDGDQPVPGDYDGNRITDVGLFRPTAGLWAIRGISRAYFGGGADRAVPADYNGDGRTGITIFRESSGLWAYANGSRIYFGKTGDIPVVE